jgi:hypothetical protein
MKTVVIALVAAMALGGCEGAYFTADEGGIATGIAVSNPPPVPYYETPFSCNDGSVYIPGDWMPYNSSWTWLPGHCLTSIPGYIYVRPYYLGGRFYPGFWGLAGHYYGGRYIPPLIGGRTYLPPPAPVVGGRTYVPPPAPVVGGRTYVPPPAPVVGGRTYVPPPAPVVGGRTYVPPPAAPRRMYAAPPAPMGRTNVQPPPRAP